MSTESDDSKKHKPSGELHQGYDLETGLLARVREWTDVFPWIRLGRTLRAAASPTLVLMTGLAYAVWCFGVSLFGSMDAGILDHAGQPLPVGLNLVSVASALSQSGWALLTFLQGLVSTSVFQQQTWYDAGKIFWSLLVWTPIALFLTRQGALLTAGRTLAATQVTLKYSMRRAVAGWLAAIVPFACVGVFAAVVGCLAWVGHFFAGNDAVEFLIAITVMLIAIPAGILAFGAQVSVPLGWAALANEPDPDALDSLSRGYEYLFRRPLQLVLYCFIAFVILVIVGTLAVAIADSASHVCEAMFRVVGGSKDTSRKVRWLLMHFANVVVLTQLWCLVGGIYLLLRQDAGGQEVEDIWRPTPPTEPSLPELP